MAEEKKILLPPVGERGSEREIKILTVEGNTMAEEFFSFFHPEREREEGGREREGKTRGREFNSGR